MERKGRRSLAKRSHRINSNNSHSSNSSENNSPSSQQDADENIDPLEMDEIVKSDLDDTVKDDVDPIEDASNGEKDEVASNDETNEIASNADVNDVASNDETNEVASNDETSEIASNADMNEVAPNGESHEMASNAGTDDDEQNEEKTKKNVGKISLIPITNLLERNSKKVPTVNIESSTDSDDDKPLQVLKKIQTDSKSNQTNKSSRTKETCAKQRSDSKKISHRTANTVIATKSKYGDIIIPEHFANVNVKIARLPKNMESVLKKYKLTEICDHKRNVVASLNEVHKLTHTHTHEQQTYFLFIKFGTFPKFSNFFFHSSLSIDLLVELDVF